MDLTTLLFFSGVLFSLFILIYLCIDTKKPNKLCKFMFPLKFVDGIPITQDAYNLCINKVTSILKKCLGNAKEECDLLDNPVFIDESVNVIEFSPLQTENGASKILKALVLNLCKRYNIALNENTPIEKVSLIISQLLLYEKDNEMYTLPFLEIFYSNSLVSNIPNVNLLMINLVIFFRNVIMLKEMNISELKNIVYKDYYLCSIFVYKPNEMYDYLYFIDDWYNSEDNKVNICEYDDYFVAFCILGRDNRI